MCHRESGPTYVDINTDLGISECEGGALTAAVDQGRGRLGVGGWDFAGAGEAEAGEGEAEED